MWLLERGGKGWGGGGGKLLCSASWMCHKVVVRPNEAIYKCLPGLPVTLPGLSPPQRLPMGNFWIMVGALGTMGRGKGREPLPNNVSKMAPDFRGRLVLGHIPHQYLPRMAEHAVVQEEELLAKQSSRTICFKCFEEDGVANFFSRELD